MEEVNPIEDICRAFAQGLRPPPDRTLAEWSDEKRILPRKSSSEHGRWRTSRFPFLKEIMWELSPQSLAKEICVMKGSQVGCTEIALNRILYNIDYNPVPHLYIQKTVDAVNRFSKQRLGPSLDAMPDLAEKLGTARGKDASDTILLKSYPGGILILGGANSAASLRSMPIAHLDLDEWDSFDSDIDEEGDPAELAIRRTANFPRRKIFYLSSPGMKETSKIEPKYLDGDQRRYHIPCPHCKDLFVLEWSLLKWDHDKPETTQCVCPNCGCFIEEKNKTWMFAEENGARWIAQNPEGRFPSFHLSALYSPLGFFSWSQAADLFLRATRNGDRELLKVFINTVLGETFSESSEVTNPIGFLTRREDYGAEIPEGALVLIAGTDIQKNRIECEVVGFGRGQESWSIEYRTFMGDTEQNDVWLQLDGFLNKIYTHASGRQMNICLAMVDTGFKTAKGYAFCKYREHRMVYPVKGVAGWGHGLLNKPTRKNEHGVFLFQAYVDELKSKFYAQLRVDNAGPGYCHFPQKEEYDEKYFKMLTAEQMQPRIIRGFRKLEWILPKGRRNEALDCRVYAIAGLTIINPDFDAIESTTGILVRGAVGQPQQITRTSGSRQLSRGVQG